MHPVRRLPSRSLTATEELAISPPLQRAWRPCSTGKSPTRMFVVTGLHSKRRPIFTGRSRVAVQRQRAEKLRVLSAVRHSRQHLHPAEPLSFPTARRAPEPRMTRNDIDRNTWNRNEKDRRPPAKFPTRVRKFIPKPLILVERMKARQLALGSPPPAASEPLKSKLHRPTTALTTPLYTRVTPTSQRVMTRSALSSGSHSSSSVSFRMSSREGVVFGSGFGMMPRSMIPFSAITLGDSSSSADTFVADSPCCVKQSPKVPVPVMEIDADNPHTNVDSDPEKKSVSDTGVSVLIDSVTGDLTRLTSRSIGTFAPAVTSTPFAPSRADTKNEGSPMAFTTSTVYPSRPLERTPGLFDNLEIASFTSRAVYPFNAPKGAYVVKLPNAVPITSPSNGPRPTSKSSTAVPFSRLPKPRVPLAILTNAPLGRKPSLEVKRPLSRVAVLSPTLVLDGVFAIPHAPPPPSSFPSLSSSSSSSSSSLTLPSLRQTLSRLPRLTSRLRRPPPPPLPPTSDTRTGTPNARAIVPGSSPPQPHSPFSSPPSPTSPVLSSGHPAGAESPRSKLAHVLTAHASPQPQPLSVSVSWVHQPGCGKRQGRGKGQRHARVPPLVMGVPVSNDPRTQREIEGLRMQRESARGNASEGGGGGGGGDGKGAIERMSLVGLGMVARLRARWERGTVVHRSDFWC